VSRERSSVHFNARPKSCWAMRAAICPSGTGLDATLAQLMPPLKATGAPVSRPSHRPYRRRSTDWLDRLLTSYSGASALAPPPSTTMAIDCLSFTAAFNSATR
jgi:hypothetical protein